MAYMAISMQERPSQNTFSTSALKTKLMSSLSSKLELFTNLYVHDTAINTKKHLLNTLMPTTAHTLSKHANSNASIAMKADRLSRQLQKLDHTEAI